MRLSPYIVLFVASFAYRVPALLNAKATNSDAAVVGLQAMHILRGELSPFLWGSGYQTSADSFVAAAFFAILGPTPIALMLSALSLHVVSTFLVWDALKRRFDPWMALLVVMPLVVSPSSVHTYALYPPRQLSLTLALAAFWAIDRRSLVLGGLFSTLAVAADPYPLLLVPVALLFAILVARIEVWRWVAGALVGAVPFVILHRLAGAGEGQLGISTQGLDHRLTILWSDCLPWAMSWKVYYAHHVMDYLPWDAPSAFVALGVLGAILVFAMAGYALVVRTDALATSAALVFPLAFAAFLGSVMPIDHFAMRYLAVLTLMMPFAMIPAAKRLGAKRFAMMFAPHLACAAIGGWVGYGPFVRGPIPVRQSTADDDRMLDALRARGIHYAMADYWTAYRLTFVANESVIVVPRNTSENRYPPYRRAFEAADRFAYVFDPGRSRESLESAELEVRERSRSTEKLQFGALTVFVATR